MRSFAHRPWISHVQISAPHRLGAMARDSFLSAAVRCPASRSIRPVHSATRPSSRSRQTMKKKKKRKKRRRRKRSPVPPGPGLPADVPQACRPWPALNSTIGLSDADHAGCGKWFPQPAFVPRNAPMKAISASFMSDFSIVHDIQRHADDRLFHQGFRRSGDDATRESRRLACNTIGVLTG